ncbi:hypothetical protein TWF481_006534 [Arthrobotrys musiformis]|uniref:Uncharacterized protein n=1 Tax=Arthrobotrys musiformis TaxID=47236 RepID=A0AAV9WA89_9PEZI
MPYIPRIRIPTRITRVVVPAIHSVSIPHIRPNSHGKPNTGPIRSRPRTRVLQHQQPIDPPEVIQITPAREYADAAAHAAARESAQEYIAAGNNVHVNEDGSKVYMYKQDDGKVLVTVAVAGEGAAGIGTTVATGVTEEEYMTRSGLMTLAGTEAALLLVLSVLLIYLRIRHRRERKKLEKKYLPDEETNGIPADEAQFADNIEASVES